MILVPFWMTQPKSSIITNSQSWKMNWQVISVHVSTRKLWVTCYRGACVCAGIIEATTFMVVLAGIILQGLRDVVLMESLKKMIPGVIRYYWDDSGYILFLLWLKRLSYIVVTIQSLSMAIGTNYTSRLIYHNGRALSFELDSIGASSVAP